MVSCRILRPFQVRRAFTLVELLVAVAIALVLVAIAIPALRLNLRGQAVREAARQVNSFIDEARSQAAGSGRPFGIIIERDGDGSYGNLSRSFRLYHCEVPAPYMGDFMPSPTNADPRFRQGSRAFFAGPAVWNSNYGVYIGSAVLSFASERMVIPGDEISFDGSSVRYTTISVTDATPDDLSGDTQWISITYAHPTAQTPSVMTETPYTSYTVDPDNSLLPTDTVARGHSFQVYRQPVKIASSVLELPRSAAIDLDWSGYGNGGTAADPMYGLQFSDFRGPILMPITIMFEPSGGVRTVTTSWCVNPAAASGPYRFSYGSRVVLEPIYLLVGRLDQVEDTFTGAANWNDPNAETPSNVMDRESLWIKINPSDGMTLTVENIGPANRDTDTFVEIGMPAATDRFIGALNARALARASAGAGG